MSKNELFAQFCVYGEGVGAVALALAAAQHGADTVLILHGEPEASFADWDTVENERNLRVLYGTAEDLHMEDCRLLSVTAAENEVQAQAFAQCRSGDFLGAVALPDMDTLSEQLLPEGEICVGLTLSGGKTLCQLEGNGSAVMGDADMYHVTIPAGGWFFARF